MAGWAYTMVVSDVMGILAVNPLGGVQAMFQGAIDPDRYARPRMDKLWEVRTPGGKSDWDFIQQLGSEGWELVASYPVHMASGITTQVVWVFKRPMSEGQ